MQHPLLPHDMRNVARRPDTLASRAEAGRWLSTLTRDSQIACQEVASALSQAERFDRFSAERHQAVLVVDKWAGPLQEQLLGEYAYARSERASDIVPYSSRASAHVASVPGTPTDMPL